MEEEFVPLSPDEVKKRREKKNESISQTVNDKFYNRGGTVAINYETLGRFDIPSTLYFRDFTIAEENDLLLVRKEELLETTIAILNKMKNQDATCLVENMLMSEFFETLIGIKKQFDTINHTHLWICNCQENVDDPKVNESIINLNNLQYKSIIEADEILKNYYKNKFDNLSDEEFKNYLYIRYKDNPSLELNEITKEQEITKIKLKEPFQLKFNNQLYSFRFSRIGDLVKARKIAYKQYIENIKDAQNKKKFEEVEKLKSEEMKYTMLISQALSLLKIDNKELTDEEKITIFASLPKSNRKKIEEFKNQFNFGVYHEQEFTCPLCGKVDKRWIQRDISYDDLLPTNSFTSRDDNDSSGLDIFISV
jgi:succinate dehydrogenase flavin-adding protein (antitoxin of CptAB toxin-antitoxin module)